MPLPFPHRHIQTHAGSSICMTTHSAPSLTLCARPSTLPHAPAHHGTTAATMVTIALMHPWRLRRAPPAGSEGRSPPWPPCFPPAIPALLIPYPCLATRPCPCHTHLPIPTGSLASAAFGGVITVANALSLLILLHRPDRLCRGSLLQSSAVHPNDMPSGIFSMRDFGSYCRGGGGAVRAAVVYEMKSMCRPTTRSSSSQG